MVPKSRNIALGGVLGALCIAFLYLASYLPTSRLFLYGVSSVFSSVILIEAGHRWAWTFYGATSILGFFLIPDKMDIIPYAIFFGFYGIIKYYIEGIRLRAAQYIAKGAVFAAALVFSYILVRELFSPEFYSVLPLWALGIAAIAVLYLYDYIYTLFVIYYEKKLRKRR